MASKRFSMLAFNHAGAITEKFALPAIMMEKSDSGENRLTCGI
jgi:hypothetical protein